MDPTYLIVLDFLDRVRLAADGSGRLTDERFWIADDPTASDASAMANDAIAAALCERLPGLTRSPERHELVYETMEDGLSPEAMVRRFHRSRLVTGHCEFGRIGILLTDGLLRLNLWLDPAPANPRPALAALFGQMAAASGYTAVPAWIGHAVNPDDAATEVLARHGQSLARLRRRAKRRAIMRRCGPASGLALTTIALCGTVWLLMESLRLGRLTTATDPTRPMTFVTLSIPKPWTFLGMFPDYRLDGDIAETGEPVRLKVFRDQIIRAGYQARFPVLPTSLPDMPYILRSQYDNLPPTLTIGSASLSSFVLLAVVPVGLWGLLIARPWLLVRPDQRSVVYEGMTRKLLWGMQIAALAILVAAARLFL